MRRLLNSKNVQAHHLSIKIAAYLPLGHTLMNDLTLNCNLRLATDNVLHGSNSMSKSDKIWIIVACHDRRYMMTLPAPSRKLVALNQWHSAPSSLPNTGIGVWGVGVQSPTISHTPYRDNRRPSSPLLLLPGSVSSISGPRQRRSPSFPLDLSNTGCISHNRLHNTQSTIVLH